MTEARPYGLSVRRAYTGEQEQAAPNQSLYLIPEADRPAPQGWTVFLPHSCDRWEFSGGYAGVSQAEAIADLERLITEAQSALTALRAGEEFGDGD